MHVSKITRHPAWAGATDNTQVQGLKKAEGEVQVCHSASQPARAAGKRRRGAALGVCAQPRACRRVVSLSARGQPNPGRRVTTRQGARGGL